VVEEEEEK